LPYGQKECRAAGMRSSDCVSLLAFIAGALLR
jgi:hypothetical protein